MDFFTHILFSYFINIYSPNFIFGIGVGILPDMDILWSAFGKKYYWAKHRAVTHSFYFIIILALSCSLIASVFFSLDFWAILPYAIITGIAHISFDLITTSGIPILFPFSFKEFKFEVDRAINPYIMVITFSTIVFLNTLGRIDYDFSQYKVIVLLITIAFILYYLVKLIIKFWLKRRYSTKDDHFDVLPTSGLFVWYLVNKIQRGGTRKIRYSRLNLLKKKRAAFMELEYQTDLKVKAPIDDKQKVKSYTWQLKEVQNYIKKFKYPLVEILGPTNSENDWEVYWYPLEIVMLDRTSALKIMVSNDGRYSAKRVFFKKISVKWYK